MFTAPLFRVVVDTNVVFEGLTKQGSAAGFVIDAWLAGLIQVHVSNALAHEYEDVLSRKLSTVRWQELQPVLGTLLSYSQFQFLDKKGIVKGLGKFFWGGFVTIAVFDRKS